jgi:formamidopyrimidine-DNA glycosylase
MTGDLRWIAGGDDGDRHRHDRVALVLEGGELRYRDMRKLQGLRLAEREEAIETVIGELGPDALGLPRAAFAERLGAGRRRVKAALIDQTAIAGLGNLLADEILWRARIAPQRALDALDEDDLAALHRAMGRVLRGAIPTGRVPPRPTWLTGARDREGAPCPRCGAALRRGRVGGRGTVWCPRCQPG